MNAGANEAAGVPTLAGLFVGLAGVFQEVNTAAKQCDEAAEIAELMSDYADGVADNEKTLSFESTLEELRDAIGQFLVSRGHQVAA